MHKMIFFISYTFLIFLESLYIIIKYSKIFKNRRFIISTITDTYTCKKQNNLIRILMKQWKKTSNMLAASIIQCA